MYSTTNIYPGVWVVHYTYRLKTKIADDQGRNPTIVDVQASEEIGALNANALGSKLRRPLPTLR